MNYQGPVRPSSEAEMLRMETAADLLAVAKILFERGDLEEALENLDLALLLLPNNPHAHWNRGQVLLALSRYEEGFKEFEWRSFLFDNPLDRESQWLGQDLTGKRLLVVHEHGYGDSIMMLRYVWVLEKLGARVVVSLPDNLKRLARWSGMEVHDDSKMFNYCCTTFGLMSVLRHGVKDIPNGRYLCPLTQFSKRMSGVGIAWSGNPSHCNDANRSMAFKTMMDGLGDRSYFMVQQVADNFADFAETAELMFRLKHIVTVDTAAVHLAGAIGHPSVHLLLPHYAMDWRWHNAKAWYPNINTYRQTVPGDWSGPLKQVREKLDAAA